MPKIMSLEDRFWEKVDKKSKDECWLWTASCVNSGYGQIADGFNGMITAHRLSWILHYGEIPKERFILHKCDNKICVNPNHLYLGTPSDNMYDRAKRNPNNQGGGCRKLSRLDMKFIKLLHGIGLTYKELGQKFDVHLSTVRNIVIGG